MRHIPSRFAVAVAAMFIASLLAVVVSGHEGTDQEPGDEAEAQAEDLEATDHETVTGRLYEESVQAMPEAEEDMAEGEEMETIDDATAQMLSYEEGLFINVDTQELEQNHAYTLWLMTVDEPENCEERPCSMQDLMEQTEEVQADVGFLDGIVAGEDEEGVFGGHQPTGELTQSWFDQGMDNPEEAEVHLIVRDHGEVVDGMAETMTNTFRGGCDDESLDDELPETALEDGEAGPNECQDIQMAVFVQEPPPVARMINE